MLPTGRQRRRNYFAFRKISIVSFLISVFIFSLYCASSPTEKKENNNLSEHEKLQIFHSSAEENLAPTRWDGGYTTTSNEARLDIFEPHIRNLGGGYIGVGSSQNFAMAAWADSQWIWLVDFTKVVVMVNKVHILFAKTADTPEKFIKIWHHSEKKAAVDLINKEYKNHPDLELIKKAYNKARRLVNDSFNDYLYFTKTYRLKNWLTDKSLYQRIHNLAKTGRIRALKGDLNGSVTIQGISKAAKEMNVPVRICYFSNAEEYFFYEDVFKKNWSTIFSDSKSMILRTLSVSKWLYPWAPGSEYFDVKGFHYNIMPVHVFQSVLSKNKNDKFYVTEFIKMSKVNKEKGFSLLKK